ncbi:MAG TPA: DUF4097 family beta strand repeat-containing protein [Longimicrobiales bacterium]|nr:DUF4097 family beta strand repeat-containing protein [Longimicrobiales bacterium]
MNSLVMGALLALSMAQQTDTVIPLGEATSLEVGVLAGSITVTGWDRNEVRVQAEHSSRTSVEVRRTADGRRITLRADSRRGPANIVDFVLQVPRSLALELGAMTADVLVEGVTGDVEAEVAQGDITVRGGAAVNVASATGKILVDGAKGGVVAETAADEIRLLNVSGEVQAESAGGDIVVLNSTAGSVDLGTIGGRIHYDGTLQRDGTYFMGTHGGSITLVVPEGAAATFHLASVHGTVINGLRGEAERSEGGQRHNLEVGGGGALVEAETFGGRISLVRKGAPGSEPPKALEGQDGIIQ